MRPLILTIVLLFAAVAAGAATLDLPVRLMGDDPVPPYYRGDVLELQLAPRAARVVQPLAAGATRGGLRAYLGIPSVDAVAASLGVASFEAEFVGEVPPTPEDTGAPDLTAFQIVHLPAGVTLQEALSRFRALPEVLSAEPIAVLPVSTAAPDDSLWFRQTWMSRPTFPRHDDHVLEAWDTQQGDTSIVVGVLDTGVLSWHPDIGGTVAGGHGNMFVNWREAGGLPGVDDDGNGFVDDVSGWDFVDSVSVIAGEDGSGKDNDPSDWAGHGTACAGIIGAIVNNGLGLAGIVPRVRILPLRCAFATGTRPSAGVDMLAAARSIAYATRMKASVLNCSWESLDLGGLGAAVTAATRAGVVLVNATGNRLSAPIYLAQREDVIAVSGVDTSDVIWVPAVRGSWVDLVAQATDMTSTFVQGTGPDSVGYRQPDYRSGLFGTSFAAPQVTGAAALLQAQRRALGLDPLTSIGMALRLRETADDHHAINPTYPNNIGTGRLNVARALTDRPTSTATRGRARSAGPPVVLRFNTGQSRVIYATSDRKLVALDGIVADTLWTASLPNVPAGNLAGGALGYGAGAGIFLGTAGGTVCGFDPNGNVLPGWPKTGLGASNTMNAGVALGDVDGDGRAEVVCGGANGNVWAWHSDGTLLAGFPFVSGTLGGAAPALADLDGVAGSEVIVLDGAGQVHALRWDGSELSGWPVVAPTAARAPIVVALGALRQKAVIVAGTGRTDAIAPNGALLWSRSYTGVAVQEPIAGDLDGDGLDEVIVATSGPASVAAYDSSGAPIARAGWPLALAAAPAGFPVMGPLMPGGRTCIGWFATAGFIAYDDSAHVVSSFPRPGLAGPSPNMGDLDGDGATEITLGTSVNDSSFYAFDAGATSWKSSHVYWPTVRGSNARTADRASADTNAVIDIIRPASVTQLVAEAVSTTSVRVRWIATGDDSLTGRAAETDLRFSPALLDAANFDAAPRWGAGIPDSSGVESAVTLGALDEGRTYWFALRVRDAAGNWSALSNVDTAQTAGQAPATIADLVVVSQRDTVVTLRWTATGDDGTNGRPASYTVVANTVPVTLENFAGAPLFMQRAATVDPGAPESLVVSGLLRGRRWYFAVRATDHALTSSGLSNLVDVVTPMGGALGARTSLAVAPRTRPSRLPVGFVWQTGSGLAGVRVTLSLHDISGRLVQRVALGTEAGGEWNWDGRDAESRLVPAGLYFARLEAGSRHVETRVVLLR